MVRSSRCRTCIYGKNCPIRRTVADLEAEIADPHLEGHFAGYRVCHHTKSACCRGFWNRHKDRFDAGQLAQRLGLVVFTNEDLLEASVHEAAPQLTEGARRDRSHGSAV